MLLADSCEVDQLFNLVLVLMGYFIVAKITGTLNLLVLLPMPTEGLVMVKL